jgi:hypothetical protein
MIARIATAAALSSIVLLGGLSLAPRAHAADAPPADSDWNYPAPVRTWELEGGYRVPIHNDQDETSYYRVSYKGSLVDSKGTPLKPSQHFEITEPKPTAPGGDRSAIELMLAKGAAQAGGELLEMNGAMPLELRGFEKLQLRGAAYVGADLDGDNVKAAVGLESRPFRIPGASAAGASNWLVIGVMGERSEATDDTTKDSTYGLLTGRLFLGKAFGWRKSASVESVARPIEASILAKAGDLAAAQKVSAELEKIEANKRTKLQQLFIDTVGDMGPSDDWAAQVRRMATGTADALTDQPTFAVYLEATGWNAFSAQDGVPRHRGLVTLTGDYWPLVSRDDVLLRVRYEWGFQRSQPDIRVNQFLVTLTVQL